MSPGSPKVEEVQATAERLLLDRGRYSPVDLLLEMRLLRPEDHQAWRRGERARLDDALAEGSAGARQCLEAADRWARALGLTAQRDELLGAKGNPARDLVASSDPRLDDLLHTSFSSRPSAEVGQLDLFLDSAATSAVNALLDSLWKRDPGESKRACGRLMELVPGHAHAPAAAALIEMLEAPEPEGPEQGLEWLGRLKREWAPAASALFGARGAELPAPQWCAAGRVLESVPFDPRHPDRHASAAYLRGFDWRRLKRSVLATPEHESEPVLLARLAEAECRLGHRHHALLRWFMLCWRAPEAFRKLIDDRDFPDSTIRDAWRLAEDQGDPESEPSPEWFPAWMLLHEQGLVRTLAPCGGKNGPERTFDLLMALLTRPTAAAESMELRRELGSIHPGLLRRYLAKLESRPPARPFTS